MKLIPKLKTRHLAAVIFYFTALGANAQTYSPASAVGAGQTGRAAIGAGEAIYLNPAALPHLLGRHLFVTGTNNIRSYAITDNTKESLMPGALSYQTFEGNDRSKQNIASLALSEFVLPQLSVGLRAKYVESQNASGEKWMQTDFDIGILWAASEALGFGLIHQNFVKADAKVPDSFKLKPQTALGATYVYKEFARFKADWLTSEDHSGGEGSWGLGLETYFNKWSVFKLGHRRDEVLKKSYNSVGLGFHGPVFYLDWAYESETRMTKNHAHFIDLGIPF